MMKQHALYTAEQTRELDRLAIEQGVAGYELMKRAGESLFNQIRLQWPDRGRRGRPHRHGGDRRVGPDLHLVRHQGRVGASQDHLRSLPLDTLREHLGPVDKQRLGANANQVLWTQGLDGQVAVDAAGDRTGTVNLFAGRRLDDVLSELAQEDRAAMTRAANASGRSRL